MFLKTVYSDAINPTSNLGFEHLDYNSCITEKMKLSSVLLTMPNAETFQRKYECNGYPFTGLSSAV